MISFILYDWCLKGTFSKDELSNILCNGCSICTTDAVCVRDSNPTVACKKAANDLGYSGDPIGVLGFPSIISKSSWTFWVFSLIYWGYP